MDKLISIIIPHYNMPDTLLRLIRSIPIKEEIEVLVVDDNSDISLETLLKKLELFPHVQLFQNDSGVKGAGASRNIALRKATGKWVLFADADDFYVEDFYDKLIPYLKSDYDMIYFSPISIDDKTGEESTRHVVYEEYINRYCHHPNLKNTTALKYGFCTPWSKLIRRSLLEEHGLRFDEIIVSNDIMCMTKCSYYSQKITATSETIYCITRGAGTLTSKGSEQNFDTRLEVSIRRYCFLRENLSKKEFRYTHVSRLALSKLMRVIFEHWGIRKLFAVLKLYHKYRIKIFDIGLLNPLTLIYEVKTKLGQFREIKKHR